MISSHVTTHSTIICWHKIRFSASTCQIWRWFTAKRSIHSLAHYFIIHSLFYFISSLPWMFIRRSNFISTSGTFEPRRFCIIFIMVGQRRESVLLLLLRWGVAAFLFALHYNLFGPFCSDRLRFFVGKIEVMEVWLPNALSVFLLIFL